MLEQPLPEGESFKKVIENRNPTKIAILKEVCDRIGLLVVLSKTEIVRSTKQSYLGLAWYVISPVITALVFVFVFNELAGMEAEKTPYFLIGIVGSVVWTYVYSSILNGSQSLVYHSDLVTKVYFPRAILPLCASIVSLVPLLIGLLLTTIFLYLYSIPFTLNLLLLPVLILFSILFTASMSLFLSVLNARYRDVGKIVQLSSSFLMYVSPIAYPVNIVPEKLLPFYHLNPVAGLVSAYRWAFFDEKISVWAVVSVLVVFAMCWFGIKLFSELERSVADYI